MLCLISPQRWPISHWTPFITRLAPFSFLVSWISFTPDLSPLVNGTAIHPRTWTRNLRISSGSLSLSHSTHLIVNLHLFHIPKFYLNSSPLLYPDYFLSGPVSPVQSSPRPIWWHGYNIYTFDIPTACRVNSNSGAGVQGPLLPGPSSWSSHFWLSHALCFAIHPPTPRQPVSSLLWNLPTLFHLPGIPLSSPSVTKGFHL